MSESQFRSLSSSRPQPGEYAAYAHPDIAVIPEDDAVAALQASRDRVIALFAPLTDALAHGRCALRTGKVDDQGSPGPDAAGSEARSLGDLLDEYWSVRAASIALFAGLGQETWSRRGTLEGHHVTGRGLAFHIVGHEGRHLRALRDRYLPVISPA